MAESKNYNREKSNVYSINKCTNVKCDGWITKEKDCAIWILPVGYRIALKKILTIKSN